MTQRVQRKRTKGFKLPPNTKCVSRPSKFANPFFVIDDFLAIKSNIKKSAVYLPIKVIGDGRENKHNVLTECYRQLLNGERSFYGINISQFVASNYIEIPTREEIKAELSQYDYLACFCSDKLPCHVDILLETINEKDSKETS